MATLHTTNPIPSRQPSETDQVILAYLEASSKDYYDEEIAGDPRFAVWYQLSSLRTGLISWYPFCPHAAVLEIGAGFGALTGLLCDRCKTVAATERSDHRAAAIARRWQEKDNLHVYAGEWSEISFDQKFDYVILTGILERAGGGSPDRERYIEYLKKAAGLLKADGILLAAVENRMGLRYFCGDREPHGGHAFDGIRRYPHGIRGYSFSREELKDIVERSGFSQSRFYYPLPDYRFPQLIYSDRFLPGPNLRERLIPYHLHSSSLVAVEQDLYPDVIENGVFPFFANSFLVEGSRLALPGGALYAAVSTDRGRDGSYATLIRDNDTVTKRPLYREGEAGAQALYEHMEDLKAHGIPVVLHTLLPDHSLELPYIPWPTLSNSIKEIIRTDPEEFLQLLDRIYAYILQSSQIVPPRPELLPSSSSVPDSSTSMPQPENALLSLHLQAADSEEERARLLSLDFGPILKKAYMELIPLNCFYNPDTKEFLYFDQEFVRENYPAGYVMFRAIHYIYCFTPGAEQCYPRKKLLEKYRMTDTWSVYLAEENRFLNEVRNHEKYRQFYRWSAVDRARIDENIKRLESEEETIADYKISDKMKKIWKVELAMLDEVSRICKKHGLTWFLVHGSLLGAIRHKGFIPWDDDLDIAMPRADYDRFLELAAGELKESLSLHTPQTEPDLFWGGFARIRDSRTTGIETRELGHKGNLGIWMDVLPLDRCTMDEKKFDRKEKKIRRCHRLLLAKIYGKDYPSYGDMKPLLWRFYRMQSHLFGHTSLCRKLDRAMRLYTDEHSEDVAIFSGYFKHRRLSAADFQSTVNLTFEGRSLPAPAGYENYMFMSMGKDYLKYPPEEERKPKHRGIFDPERPYGEYSWKLTGMFEDIRGKKIILFGSGMMFEDYMKKWGNRYRPDFLVDNDENKWGRQRFGIPIKEPGEILKIPKEKRRLILCSFYYKEIEKQLAQMGIQDYCVYVQHLEWIVKSEE